MPDAQSAEKYCKSIIDSFKSKATHNKNESIYFFWVSMGGALLAPLFVTLGEGMANALGSYGSVFVFSKLIPSILSVAVAFSTAWLQLRKPQQLWALYRTSQRELENCLSEFQYKIKDFENCENTEKLLAKKVSEIALAAHYHWLPMVPNPENLSTSLTTSKKDADAKI